MSEKRFSQEDLDRLELRGIKVYKQTYKKITVNPIPINPDAVNELIFTIHGELCTLNEYINAERTNRYIAAKIKRDETKRCHYCALQTKVRLEGKWNVAFSWYVKDQRKDNDNVCFAKKFCLDGCVSAGLIGGDGMKFIGNFSDEFYVDAEYPRVEVRFWR